jgi:hypothetical protein
MITFEQDPLHRPILILDKLIPEQDEVHSSPLELHLVAIYGCILVGLDLNLYDPTELQNDD